MEGHKCSVKAKSQAGNLGFIQAILMSGRRYKKLSLLIEFSNSIFIKFYFKAYWR